MTTQHSSEANYVVEEDYPMILVGRDHRVSYGNQRAYQLFGYDRGSLHGISIEQLLSPTRRAEVRNIQAVLRGQSARSFRSVTRKADGALIDVNLALEPCLDHRGSVVAVKVRCERILRSPPPTPPLFEGVSGTRPIPPQRESIPRPPQRAVKEPWPGSERLSAADETTSTPLPRPSRVPIPQAEHVLLPSRSATPSTPPRVQHTSEWPTSVVASPRMERISEWPTAVVTTPSSTPSKVSSHSPPVSNEPIPASEPPRTPSVTAMRPSVSPQLSRSSATPKSGRVPVVRPSGPPTQLVLTDDGAGQLETALQLLNWLRQRVEAADGPLGDPSERARALVVLNETTELVAQCRCELKREPKPGVART